MIKSMTAFARIEGTISGFPYVLELRSVNHRFLDLHLHAPSVFIPLELKIHALVKAQLARGKLDLWIRPGRGLDPQTTTSLLRHAKALGLFLQELKNASGVADVPTLAHLLQVKDLLTSSDENEGDCEKIWPDLDRLLATLLAEMTACRQTEGEFLGRELKKMGTELQRFVDTIAGSIPSLALLYRERLSKRLAGLLSALPRGSISLDPGLVESEIALFAERSDISEEICRFKCHLERWESHLGEGGPIGRRLDFLLQEMHRELNTIGSKGNDAGISQTVVEAKLILEKMREQVQNIE